MKEKVKDIAKRLTGISLPGGFGISWTASKTDRDIAKHIITFFEDRRVLYSPSEQEIPEHCVHSVIEIRHFITEQLASASDTEFCESLRALRASCRKFLDLVGENGHDPQPARDIVRYGAQERHWASWTFNAAIGELRGVFGVHLAKIAVMYKVDVEENLASIFPQLDQD